MIAEIPETITESFGNSNLEIPEVVTNIKQYETNSKDCETSNVGDTLNKDGQTESQDKDKNLSEEELEEGLKSDDNCSEISTDEHPEDLNVFSESKEYLNDDKESNDCKDFSQPLVQQNFSSNQNFSNNSENFQVPQSFKLSQTIQGCNISHDQESPRNDHNYDQKKFKLAYGEVSTTLTEPMKLMKCQEENKTSNVPQDNSNNNQRFYRTHSNEKFHLKFNQGSNIYQQTTFIKNNQSFYNPGQSFGSNSQNLNQNQVNPQILTQSGSNVHHSAQSPSHNQGFTHHCQSPLRSNQYLPLGSYQSHPSPYQSHASPYHTQPSPHHYQVMSSPHGNQVQYHQVKSESHQIRNVYYKPPESYNKFGEIYYQNSIESNKNHQSYQKSQEHHIGYNKVQEIRQNLKRSNETLSNLPSNESSEHQTKLMKYQDLSKDQENFQNSPNVYEKLQDSPDDHQVSSKIIQNSPNIVDISKKSPKDSEVSSKSSEVIESTIKYQEFHQNPEDSVESSSLSPSIESCDDENSFTESQNNFNHFYQPQQQNSQTQPWQYQNYAQNQSHYGYNQSQYSNYSYNYYQEPTTISYMKSPSSLSCEVCVRTFKTASNLTRHLASKTHLKKLSSKKKTISNDVNFVTKKSHVSITDINEEERKILWQIDDEIFEFLKCIEKEKVVKKIEIYPTPPLSPSVGKMVIAKN